MDLPYHVLVPKHKGLPRQTMFCAEQRFALSVERFLNYRCTLGRKTMKDITAFRRYCRDAGINYRSSHKARKTFISALIDEGMNINTIREMVGHADERTTMTSYCFDRRSHDERKEQLERALST